MKNKRIIVSALLFFIISGFWWKQRSDSLKVPLNKRLSRTKTQVDVPTLAHPGKKIGLSDQSEKKPSPMARRLPSNKQNKLIHVGQNDINSLKKFEHQTLSYLPENLSLVVGIVGKIKKSDDETAPLYQAYGIYYFEDKGTGGESVVFNQKTSRYGVYTGNVVAKGNFQKLLDFSQTHQLEILLQNPLSRMIIFKLTELQDLKVLKNAAAEERIELDPDITYGQASLR